MYGRFIKRRFSSLSDLLLSNVLSNLLMFFGIYILSKFIIAEEFGKYSLFLAVSIAVQNIFTLRYDQAIPTAMSQRTANILFIFCILFSILLFSLGLMTIFFIHDLVFQNYRDIVFDIDGLFLIWPACLSLALYTSTQALALRASALRKLAISRVMRAFLVVVTQILSVIILESSYYYLILAEILANILVTTFLIISIKVQLSSLYSFKGSTRKLFYLYNIILFTVKRFRIYALVGLPHAFIHQACTALYAGLIGSFYGAAALGQYYLMRRMIFGITTLLSNATYQLGVSEASASRNERTRLLEIFKSVIIIIAMCTIPASLLMVFVGPFLFSTIFGDEWKLAGDLARATFLLIAIEPIASAIAFIPLYLKRQKEAFVWSIGQNLAGLGALSIVYLAAGSVNLALLASSLSVCIVLTAYLVRLWSLCYMHGRF